MASALMESTNSTNLCDFVPLIGENYDVKLKQSMQDLLAEIGKESPDFSSFIDAFYELMQAKVDPPFEVIWVYAALKFRNGKDAEGDTLDRISTAKNLFQLLSTCSASSGGSKSIALLVPVVFEVYEVLLELFGKELSVKREKKVMKEVKSLLDTILGHISICCSESSGEESDSVGQNVIVPFTDLIFVWLNANEGFESYLPLLSRDVCSWISTRESHVGYLAGAVIMQAFLLKLCLCSHQAKPTDELEKNLRSWAVGSISSLQNIYFFEILLRTALGTPLPLSSIVKPESVILLKKVLFDAVLLVEYPVYRNAKHMESLALTRLIVTHEAVEYFWGCADQNRAISYIKSFSASRLPLQIIEWVTSQNCLEEKASRINGSSPRSLMKWLLGLEDQGIRVFEDDVLKSHAKLSLNKFQSKQPAANLEDKMLDDDLFYVDKMGEEENSSEKDNQIESVSAATVAAAQMMKLDDGMRKRKGISTEKKVKFVKYDLHQNPDSVKAETSVANDSSSGESEAEDPDSDTDTQATV